MPKIEIPKAEMLDILWESDKVVLDEIIGKSRWSIQHRLIFAHDGKRYETHYSVGATECQDERPWEYEAMVECVEVVEILDVVSRYVVKE